MVDANKIPYPLHDETIINVYDNIYGGVDGKETGLWDAKEGDLIYHYGENKFSIVTLVWNMASASSVYKEISYKGLYVETTDTDGELQKKFADVSSEEFSTTLVFQLGDALGNLQDICLVLGSDGLIYKEDRGEVLPIYTGTPTNDRHATPKSYVDNAIGNIETAIENIIAKYGLGGENA